MRVWRAKRVGVRPVCRIWVRASLPNPGRIWQDSAMVQRGWTEPLDTERLLTEWRWLCPEGLTVIDRNSFGDLFLADGAGRVHRLNVGSGELALIAVSAPTFIQLAKTPEKRE